MGARGRSQPHEISPEIHEAIVHGAQRVCGGREVRWGELATVCGGARPSCPSRRWMCLATKAHDLGPIVATEAITLKGWRT